jgi:two-component system chemotaxis response regulator CheB
MTDSPGGIEGAAPGRGAVVPAAPERPFRIVVVAASLGGVGALKLLVGGLRPDVNAAIFIVLHLPATRTSQLPELLSSWGPVPAVHPADGEVIRAGRIYVAPPGDRHMTVRKWRVRLTAGPKENHVRPAADPLFRSAAAAYDGRVIGVVLTGCDSDGSKGLAQVAACGGITVVQDPEEAHEPSMPFNALEATDVDYRLPLRDIAALIASLASPPSSPGHA